jgi:hypothetical protein
MMNYYFSFFQYKLPTRCTIWFEFITINSLYMFQVLICSSSGGNVYTTGIFCVYYVSWQLVGLTLLAASRQHNIHKQYTNFCIYSTSWWWAIKCSKHVEAINLNKLKANSATCCTDILRCTVNKLLNFSFFLSLSLSLMCMYVCTYI